MGITGPTKKILPHLNFSRILLYIISAGVTPSLAEIAIMPVWTIDLNDKYVDCSTRFAAMLGYTRDEVLGKTPWDFMPPEEGLKVYQWYRMFRESRSRFRNLANHAIHRNGHLVPLLTSGTPVVKAGRLIGYRGIDIPRNPVNIAKLRLEAKGFTSPIIWEIVSRLCQKSDSYLVGLLKQLGAQHPLPPHDPFGLHGDQARPPS